jgi:DNA adenine methylase
MASSSPLKWHGGKAYLATRIRALFPPHVHYVEPYAGSLAVLLAGDGAGVSEVVNDLNGELTNFWRVLQQDRLFAIFRREMEATPFSEAEFNGAAQEFDPGDPVACAINFFIRCRQSLAGRMYSFAPLSRNRTRRGMNEQASAWLSAVEGLPAVHARLKRVVIVGPKDALEVIRHQDGPKTLFYLDPPYLHETRASADVYAHEMTYQQHRGLLEALKATKGKFLLSGYPNDLYRGYANTAPRWTCHEFDLPNHSAGGAEKRRMTECVWTNF